MGTSHRTFFATCAPGVEPILHDEVRALRFARAERQVGGVLFRGTLQDAWRANLWLRTAVRVLMRLGRFEARDGDALYRAVDAVDWSTYLRPDGTLWVQAQSRESALDHTRFAAQRVKDAIVDQLRTGSGERPSVSRDQPDLRVHLHLYRDRATLSVDTSGESLHKRGWRRSPGRAPLPETLAAAMVLAGEWDRRAPLLDPLCGSGTLLIEAAWIAHGFAPGLLRERFGFDTWPGHDGAAFERLREEARSARSIRRKLRLAGGDVDPERVADARENAEQAGVGELVEVEPADALDLTPRRGWNAWIASNLPFGERVRSGSDVPRFHTDFGRVLRERCVGFHVSLLAGSPALADALTLPGARRTTLGFGGTERVLLTGEIAAPAGST